MCAFAEGGERCICHSFGNCYPYRSLLHQPGTKVIDDSSNKASLEKMYRTICNLSFIKLYPDLLQEVLMWKNCETGNVLNKGYNRSISPENLNLCTFTQNENLSKGKCARVGNSFLRLKKSRLLWDLCKICTHLLWQMEENITLGILNAGENE